METFIKNEMNSHKMVCLSDTHLYADPKDVLTLSR